MKKLIKKWFKLFDQQDFENALSRVGDVRDRDHFEWKLKNELFK